MERKCLYCTKWLIRGVKEGPKDWNKRQVCNKSCRASFTHSKTRHLYWRNNETERKCSICKTWFSATGEYFKKDKRKLHGISGVCKKCLKECAYQIHKGTEGTWTKEEKYQAFIQQEGKCAICKIVMLSWTKAKADHCHKTKRQRGLLCDKCNRGIGFFNDDIHILQSAIFYIKKYSPVVNAP